MKSYVILGSNNFWYSYFEAETEEQINNELEEVYENMRNNQYIIEDHKIDNLRIMEINIIRTIEMEEISENVDK